MNPTNEQLEAGQAVYNPKTLAMYDLIVLGLSNRFIWKCATPLLLEHYNQHVTGNHLDIGVGSGYFLDQCQFPTPDPVIVLMDLNEDALTYAAGRISRYNPKTYQRNVLEPVSIDGQKFDSIGLNYLFHCIPGTLDTKSVAFDHLKELMNPGAVIFGSTILQADNTSSWTAQRLMAFYNRKGIFSNQDDRLEDLEDGLNQRFSEVFIDVVGCVALFSARI